METAYSEPKVTIDLKEYEALRNAPSEQLIREQAAEAMYKHLMSTLYEQAFKVKLHYDNGRPFVDFKFPFDQYKKYYINA